MAFVDWTAEALESVALYDAWRISHGWEPMALELFDAVEAYFCRQDPDQPPHYLPGRPVKRLGEPAELRVVLIRVRSKNFRVFFRYLGQVFEVLRIYHPRER